MAITERDRVLLLEMQESAKKYIALAEQHNLMDDPYLETAKKILLVDLTATGEVFVQITKHEPIFSDRVALIRGDLKNFNENMTMHLVYKFYDSNKNELAAGEYNSQNDKKRFSLLSLSFSFTDFFMPCAFADIYIEVKENNTVLTTSNVHSIENTGQPKTIYDRASWLKGFIEKNPLNTPTDFNKDMLALYSLEDIEKHFKDQQNRLKSATEYFNKYEAFKIILNVQSGLTIGEFIQKAQNKETSLVKALGIIENTEGYLRFYKEFAQILPTEEAIIALDEHHTAIVQNMNALQDEQQRRENEAQKAEIDKDKSLCPSDLQAILGSEMYKQQKQIEARQTAVQEKLNKASAVYDKSAIVQYLDPALADIKSLKTDIAQHDLSIVDCLDKIKNKQDGIGTIYANIFANHQKKNSIFQEYAITTLPQLEQQVLDLKDMLSRITVDASGTRILVGRNVQIEGKFKKNNQGNDIYTYSYDSPDKPLFVEGVSPNDVKQGDLKDCYFLASVAALAKSMPSMFKDSNPTDNVNDALIKPVMEDGKQKRRNGFPLYRVRLYVRDSNGNFIPVEVEITDQLPKETHTILNSAVSTTDNDPTPPNWLFAEPSKELWVALLEKALVELKGSYSEAERGNPMDAMQMLLGEKAQPNTLAPTHKDCAQAIQTALSETPPRLVVASSKPGPNGESYHRDKTIKTPSGIELYYTHAYMVHEIAKDGTSLTLFNPHNETGDTFSLPFDELKAFFSYVQIA